MDINYELYKVFYHVAVSLSFSEASKQLFISQSAVSQSVKVLEKKLNRKLFIRSTKRVSLTPEGEILFKHIQPAMNLIKQGENQLLESGSLGGGQLRIGASDTICRYFLVQHLKQFHQNHPHVHIKVTNRTSIQCAALLEHGQVDCIVVNFPNSALNSTHIFRTIHEFHDVFVANRQYFPLDRQCLSLKELQKKPILMLEHQSTTSEFLLSVFQSLHLDLVPEIELSSNELLIDLARIGLGIAFVPDFCIPKDDRDLFVLKIKEELPARQMVAACNEKLPLSQTAKQFMEML